MAESSASSEDDETGPMLDTCSDKLHGRLRREMSALNGHSSWCTQMRAMLRRNISIKLKQKRRTLMEVLGPLYIFVLLGAVRSALPSMHVPAVTQPAGRASVTANVSNVAPLVIMVTPDGPVQQQFAGRLVEQLRRLRYNCRVYCVPDQWVMEQYAREGRGTPVLGVVLAAEPRANFTYTVRVDQRMALGTTVVAGGDQCHGTSVAGGLLERPMSCPNNGLFYSGLLTVQNAIESVFLSTVARSAMGPANITLMNGPKREADAVSSTILRVFIPLYMVISLSHFITYQLILVVGEKEAKIKDGLKLMGLYDSVYWFSWFSVYGSYVVFVAGACVTIIHVAQVFSHSNMLLVFVFYVMYGWSLVLFGFMLTPFFNKAKVAGGVGSFMVTIVSLLYLCQVYLKSLPPVFFWLISLMSPVAFALGIDRAVELDAVKEGVNMATMWKSDGGASMAQAFIMLAVDMCLYGFMAFYLDNIMPTEFGRRESVFFLFQRSYWMRFKQPALDNNRSCDSSYSDAAISCDNVEPVWSEAAGQAAVRVRALRKNYQVDGKDVPAVNDLSLDIYEGQITAILGHNGAGKSTFFNVLTGLTKPTAGTASVYGLNITDAGDMRELWSMMGICPQHDILMQELTPRDHLRFTATIRNVPSSLLMPEVERCLSDVELLEKADEPVAVLSGGQRRKLSIAQALIGDPRVVILDEPTAGVDPCSRRHMWQLLSRRKAGRVVLLTTHFMDEADVLADRKAVISSGRLRCCGSSMYLKKKFGLGHHLTVVLGADANTDQIDALVADHVPAREMGRCHGNELAFILPMESTPVFPELFNNLERQQKALGVLSYGISLTSLEEVFLQLAEQDLAEDSCLSDVTRNLLRRRVRVPQHSESQPLLPDSDSSSALSSLSHSRSAMGGQAPEVPLHVSQWRSMLALLRVRFLNFTRVRANVVFTLLMPLIMMYLGLSMNNSGGQRTPPQNISLHMGAGLYPWLNTMLLHNTSSVPLQAFSEGAGLHAQEFDGKFATLLNVSSALAAVTVHQLDVSAGNESQMNFSAVMDDSAFFGASVIVNSINNGIHRVLAGADTSPHINMLYRPLPAVSSDMQLDIGLFTSGFMIGFMFLLFPCNISLELVMERQLRIRNQLRVNGVGFGAYFMSFWLLNLPIFLTMWASMLMMVRYLNVVALSSSPALSMLAILYFEYCVVGLLFAAVCSNLFDRLDTAQTIYPNMANLFGMISYMVVALLDMSQVGQRLGMRLHFWFSLLNPFYTPCGCIYFISRKYLLVSTFAGRSLTYADFWSDPVFTVPLLAQPVQIALCWIVLVWMDKSKHGGRRLSLWALLVGILRFAGRPFWKDVENSGADNEDDDVLAERSRVGSLLKRMRSLQSPPMIVAHDVCKSYRLKNGSALKAVDRVSFAVDAGEVFGLLGPNGAGKTSVMRSMIAEESLDEGQIFVNGTSICDPHSRVFQEIGYCPQFDSLWPFITLEEHIECWAQVRGVPASHLRRLIDYYVDGLWMREHSDKRAIKCSGGTRRKLSYALSMLGRPRIVLLDEPSTGMDPQSKRFLWDTILSAFEKHRGAVLTTHSMEEADALCSRVAIMVQGRLKCLGSTQHLKNKYGGGYTLEMKLTAGSRLLKHSEQVEALIHDLFPSALVEENYGEMVRYKMPQEEVTSLAEAFGALERAKTQFGVEEYNLSQTTLEQVFLRFAKEQEDTDTF